MVRLRAVGVFCALVLLARPRSRTRVSGRPARPAAGRLGAGRQAGLRDLGDQDQPRLVHAAQRRADGALLPGPQPSVGALAGVHGRRQPGHHGHGHAGRADLHADVVDLEVAAERTYATDPERSVVLVQVRFVSLDGEDHDVEIEYDPQLYNDGTDDVGWTRGHALLSHDSRIASALVARPRSRARARATRATPTTCSSTPTTRCGPATSSSRPTRG